MRGLSYDLNFVGGAMSEVVAESGRRSTQSSSLSFFETGLGWCVAELESLTVTQRGGKAVGRSGSVRSTMHFCLFAKSKTTTWWLVRLIANGRLFIYFLHRKHQASAFDHTIWVLVMHGTE
jgi:hypothetical protein